MYNTELKYIETGDHDGVKSLTDDGQHMTDEGHSRITIAHRALLR